MYKTYRTPDFCSQSKRGLKESLQYQVNIFFRNIKKITSWEANQVVTGIGIPKRTQLVKMYSVVLKIQACQTGHTAQYKITWSDSPHMTINVSLEVCWFFFRFLRRKNYIKLIRTAKYSIEAGTINCMIIG